jgi:prepilin-type N-terminal cleavage/methylation domain-containing protein
MLLDLKQRGFMVTKILKRITDFCSLKAPEGTTRNNRKAGFTLVELMVVIAMVNVLSGVVIPKCTDLIEKAKERTDLLKFFYLRDALDRALYEDDAFRIDESSKCGNTQNNKDKLSEWLATEEGVSLFVIELHETFAANYQGENKKRTGDEQNMCGLIASEGFWSQALRDAGFGAVADIVIARADGDKFNQHPGDYVTENVKRGNETWTRSYPKTPLFNSRVLNGDPNSEKTGNNGQNRYSMKVRWTNCDPESHSLDVFLTKNGTTNVLTSRLGTVFSTATKMTCPAKKKS